MADTAAGMRKVGWKEWLPFYGIYQVYKDSKEGRPSIADYQSKSGIEGWKYRGNLIYQSACIANATALSVAYYTLLTG